MITLEGDPRRGLTWKVCCADLTRIVRDSIAAIASGAQARVLEVRRESGCPDSALGPTEPELPAALRIAQQALEKLKWQSAIAPRVLRESWDRAACAGKPAEAITTEELILDACRRGG